MTGFSLAKRLRHNDLLVPHKTPFGTYSDSFWPVWIPSCEIAFFFFFSFFCFFWKNIFSLISNTGLPEHLFSYVHAWRLDCLTVCRSAGRNEILHTCMRTGIHDWMNTCKFECMNARIPESYSAFIIMIYKLITAIPQPALLKILLVLMKYCRSVFLLSQINYL